MTDHSERVIAALIRELQAQREFMHQQSTLLQAIIEREQRRDPPGDGVRG